MLICNGKSIKTILNSPHFPTKNLSTSFEVLYLAFQEIINKIETSKSKNNDKHKYLINRNLKIPTKRNRQKRNKSGEYTQAYNSIYFYYFCFSKK
jgi:hypothetical protein